MDQAPFLSSKQTHMLVYFNVRRLQVMDFWRKSYCGLWTGILGGLKIKALMMDYKLKFYKTFADELNWSCVDYL